MLPEDEARILLPEARRILGVSAGTIIRWCDRGVVIAGGKRIKLEAERIGARWRTSVEAVHRFKAACNPGDDAAKPAHAVATPSEIKRRDAAAMKELRKLGV